MSSAALQLNVRIATPVDTTTGRRVTELGFRLQSNLNHNRRCGGTCSFLGWLGVGGTCSGQALCHGPGSLCCNAHCLRVARLISHSGQFPHTMRWRGLAQQQRPGSEEAEGSPIPQGSHGLGRKPPHCGLGGPCRSIFSCGQLDGTQYKAAPAGGQLPMASSLTPHICMVTPGLEQWESSLNLNTVCPWEL